MGFRPCSSKQCPKRYSLPIGLALLGTLLAGAVLLINPCGIGATTLNDTMSAPFLCAVVGLIFMGCGIIFTYFMYRRSSEVEWLQQHGEKIDARVVAVNEIPSRNPTNKLSYQVVCEACDPLSGRLRRFLSEPLASKPPCSCGSSKVEVLTDPSNPSLYHVEV